jgi:predicted TIM-barrel fold metal-dependent hydrolase
MDRRSFLLALSSTMLRLPGITVVGFTDANAAGATPKLIDAHCHIFNANDLPAEGFIENVVIPNNQKLGDLEGDLKSALTFYIRELASWSYEKAKKAEDEIDFLGKVASGAKPHSPSEIGDREQQHAIDLVQNLIDIATSPDVAAKAALRGVGRYAPVAIVGLIHQEALPDAYYAPVSGFNDGKPKKGSVAINFFDLSDDEWESAETLGKALYSSNGQAGPYLRWVLYFTRYRHEIASALSDVHGGNAVLATPALIDYTRWLGDKHEVSLDLQTDVMSAVSRQAAGASHGLHIHGYAPFDPLRQVLFDEGKESTSPIERVKKAILSQGFIGVKLYPPMGFQSLGNASIVDGNFFGKERRKQLGIKNIGAGLDRALRELYLWCQQNEVPILAHARHSNGPSVVAEDRAAPKHWKLVLDEFPTLRVCLAHFGDFPQGLKEGAKLSDTWEWQIASLMKAKPGSRLYTDISYLDAALIVPGQKDGPRKEAQRMFGSTIAEFGDELRQRLIFGSDWIMLGIERNFAAEDGNGGYDRKVEEFLKQITVAKPGQPKAKDPAFSNDQLARIFSANAAQFLGLGTDQRNGGTRGRLEAFYSTNSLNADWLASYD